MNFSMKEIYNLTLADAHELVLYADHEKHSRHREELTLRGVDLSKDKYFEEFFSRYNDYFRLTLPHEGEPKKIIPRPLLNDKKAD